MKLPSVPVKRSGLGPGGMPGTNGLKNAADDEGRAQTADNHGMRSGHFDQPEQDQEDRRIFGKISMHANAMIKISIATITQIDPGLETQPDDVERQNDVENSEEGGRQPGDDGIAVHWHGLLRC